MTFISYLPLYSRNSITNYAKANNPEKTNQQIEIGYRFFEGACLLDVS